jgi:phosphoserine phosphatase
VQGTADRLLAHRKLLLILDLDHTLLNSNRFQDIPPQCTLALAMKDQLLRGLWHMLLAALPACAVLDSLVL